MGKIRIKTLGLPGEEEKQKEKAKTRKEAKKAAKTAAKAPGFNTLPTPLPEEEVAEKAPEVEEKTKATRPPKVRGKKYQKAAKRVDKNRLYPLGGALELVKKTSLTRFDGSVEAHFNTTEKGLSGTVKFPHSTGKTFRVAIASDQ